MEKELTEEEKIEFAILLRRVESITKAADVPLDMSKQRFIFTRATVINLVLKIQKNEFTRGLYEGICYGCQKKKKSDYRRGYSDSKKFWDFCKGCPVKAMLQNK